MLFQTSGNLNSKLPSASDALPNFLRLVMLILLTLPALHFAIDVPRCKPYTFHPPHSTFEIIANSPRSHTPHILHILHTLHTPCALQTQAFRLQPSHPALYTANLKFYMPTVIAPHSQVSTLQERNPSLRGGMRQSKLNIGEVGISH